MTFSDQDPDLEHLATRLCAKVEIDGGILFNSIGEPYARILNVDHFEIWPVGSRRFKSWLANQSYQETGRVPGNESVKSAVRLAEAIAFHRGPEIDLYNRVARGEDGAIYYDIADNKNHVVQITPAGWEIIDSRLAPIIFRRYKHQRAAVMPDISQQDKRQERLERFFDLVNHDPKTKILHLVQLVFSFVPDLPHPVPNVYGEQGSTKTTYFSIWKAFVDRSKISTLSLPRKQVELIQKIDHHWFAPFDNINKLAEWQSDIICRSSTGEGFSKRKLYSDDEDHIYSYKRVVGLNGINVVAEKPDLLDRSILHELPAIPIKDRLTEKELWNRFDELAPGIMAAIFDTLSVAMGIFPTVKTTGLYRMADFTQWGIAISLALGYTAEDFLDEYQENINIQTQEALAGDPLAVVLLRYLEDYFINFDKLEMTPTECYNELEGRAQDYGIKITDERWPKNAQAMSRRLNVIKPNLAKQGLDFQRVEVKKERKKRRLWRFARLEVSDYCVTSETTEPVIGGDD